MQNAKLNEEATADDKNSNNYLLLANQMILQRQRYRKSKHVFAPGENER